MIELESNGEEERKKRRGNGEGVRGGENVKGVDMKGKGIGTWIIDCMICCGSSRL